MTKLTIDEIDEASLIAIMEDSAFLEHYGVKGMKWGVRNSETLRKYAGSMKRKMSTISKFTSSSIVKAAVRKIQGAKKAPSTKVSKSYSERKVRHLEKKEAAKALRTEKKEASKALRAEKKALRKEAGMSPVKYEKLRRTTLKSHDPEVVARGMHLLTDSELSDKIVRLQSEDVISKLAASKAERRTKAAKNRYEAFKANPIYDLGSGAVKQLANDTLHKLGYDTIVGKGINPVLEQRVSYLAKKAQRAFNSRIASETINEEKASRMYNDFANKSTKDNSYKSKFGGSNSQAKTYKTAAAKPKNHMSSERAVIESIETISFESPSQRALLEQRGRRLLLPAGRG